MRGLLKARLKMLVAAGGVALAAVPLVPAPPAGAQAAPALVTLVHGLRGVVADVYLDGSKVLETFEPERSTDPLPIPAGVHIVDVRLAGSPPDSSPAVRGTLDIAAGARLSAVVGLTASGEPTITTYPDDLTPLAPGQARLVARHAAAAPPVDVVVDQAPVATGLANQKEATAAVAAGTHAVASTESGAETPVTPPQDVPLAEGTSTSMYLIGSQAQNSLTWIAVRVSGLGTAPAGVPTGNSGLAAPAQDGGFGEILAALAAASAIAFVTLLGRRALVRSRA